MVDLVIIIAASFLTGVFVGSKKFRKFLLFLLDLIRLQVYYDTCEGDGMANLKPHRGTQKPRAFA